MMVASGDNSEPPVKKRKGPDEDLVIIETSTKATKTVSLTVGSTKQHQWLNNGMPSAKNGTSWNELNRILSKKNEEEEAARSGYETLSSGELEDLITKIVKMKFTKYYEEELTMAKRRLKVQQGHNKLAEMLHELRRLLAYIFKMKDTSVPSYAHKALQVDLTKILPRVAPTAPPQPPPVPKVNVIPQNFAPGPSAHQRRSPVAAMPPGPQLRPTSPRQSPHQFCPRQPTGTAGRLPNGNPTTTFIIATPPIAKRPIQQQTSGIEIIDIDDNASPAPPVATTAGPATALRFLNPALSSAILIPGNPATSNMDQTLIPIGQIVPQGPGKSTIITTLLTGNSDPTKIMTTAGINNSRPRDSFEGILTAPRLQASLIGEPRVQSSYPPLPISQNPIYPDPSVKPLPPKLKLNVTANSVSGDLALRWDVLDPTLRHYATSEIKKYHLYVYEETRGHPPTSASQWKQLDSEGIDAMDLPMLCNLAQFKRDRRYFFTMCGVDVYVRQGEFCEPAAITIQGKS